MSQKVKYDLNTIEDFLKIPSDRLPVAMVELADYLNELRVRLDALNSLEGVTVPFPKITWFSEGKSFG